jgi:diguanylate cyclase (GGDEF)-like protein/PAS domain S-box-containing protein
MPLVFITPKRIGRAHHNPARSLAMDIVAGDETTKIHRFRWIMLLLWTCIIIAVVGMMLFQFFDSEEAVNLMHARAYIERDMVYRRWNLARGGLYARIDEKTPPNPYMDVPDRDLTTVSGLKLTLVNPAYMTRQVHDLIAEQGDGVLGHVTSLDPLRPQNNPDAWERDALQALERGEKEVSGINEIDGIPYLRLMRPLMTEKRCLRCHEHQGYKVGDVLGGIGVSIPYLPIAAAKRTHILQLVGGNLALWLIGMLGIDFGTRALLKGAERRRESQEKVNSILRAASIGIGLVVDREFKEVNGALCKMTGYSRDELLFQGVQMVYPDEQEFERVETELYEEQISAMGKGSVETRFRRKNGEVIDVYLSSALVNAADSSGGVTLSALDITQRKAAEREIQESHRRLVEAEQFGHMGNWELDLVTGRSHWSDEVHRIVGSDPSREAGPVYLSTVVHPDDWPNLEASVKSAIKEGTLHEMEYRIRREEGEERWLYCKGERKLDESGQPTKLIGIVQDITERRQQEERLRLSASVFENTSEGVMITNARGDIVDVNRAFSEIAGYTRDEVIGQNPRVLKSGRHDTGFYRDMWHSLIDTGRWRGEIWNRRKDGSLYPEWLNISRVSNSKGELTHYVGVFTDITGIKQSQAQLAHLAHHDPLTDLPNRLLLNERLTHALARADRHKTLVAVIFFDLDNFKNINDSFGHPVGDQLLQQVADRLVDIVRTDDTVARIGGDEFVLLLEDLEKPEDAVIAADKLQSVFLTPFELKDHVVRVTSSVGICLYPQDGRNAAVLLRNADAAMYRAKEEGRDTYRFYTEELTNNAFERVLLENNLREALEKEELVLYYQPQVDLESGRIIGLEALIRWRHPTLGMVSPSKFIPMAESSGLIIPIGEWVLNTACRQAQEWLEEGMDFGRISVNIAGPQIQRGELVETVEKALTASGLPTSRLELEVTESFIMQQAEIAIGQLNKLREVGVTLAIDDFGTGYSSLNYLKKLPIHKLKIDQSFVNDIPDDANDMAISGAVIAMGKSLGLVVIAEGVETREQVEFLKNAGCNEAQGFLYGKPLDHQATSRLLAERNK